MKHSHYKEEFDRRYAHLFVNGKFMWAGALLQRAAKLYGEREALTCNDRTITYRELYESAWQLTLLLKQKNIGPSDRVCIFIENSIEFYIAYFGAWQTGAVVVPLNTFLTSHELEHIVRDARPRAFLTSIDNYGMAQTAARAVVVDPTEIFFHGVSCDHIEHKLTGHDDNSRIIPRKDADDLAVLLYTSGTTGLPKGVMLSSRALLTNVIQSSALIDVLPDDKVLGVLPLFHSFAQNTCVWGAVWYGCQVIIVPRIERRSILNALVHRPTLVLGVPALYGILAMLKQCDLSFVRYFVCGGDALPEKIRTGFALVYHRKLCNGYGLTETSPVIAVDIEDSIKPSTCVGKVLEGIEIQIRNEHDEVLDEGSMGILWVKGPNLMLGYYNAPAMTAAVLKDGWFNTGDLAYQDHQGRIIIGGREKDLIINKGFNIYPQEIENVLMLHPDVIAAAVIGVTQSEVGQIPLAFVSLKKGSRVTASDLEKICKDHLAPYKLPREYHINQDLPLTSVGKIDKKKLRLLYDKKD